MVYVALLRGINVGGHKLIKMAELKAMFEALGLTKVQTYIQSGNVLFASNEEEAEPLRRRIEQQIEAVFGFDVPVALRTLDEWERIIAQCPFPADESLYVAVMTEAPLPEGVDRLQAHKIDGDEFRIGSREVYLLYRQPVHKSKLTNNLLEKKLGVPATSRNWQTMTRLAALGREMAVLS